MTIIIEDEDSSIDDLFVARGLIEALPEGHYQVRQTLSCNPGNFLILTRVKYQEDFPPDTILISLSRDFYSAIVRKIKYYFLFPEIRHRVYIKRKNPNQLLYKILDFIIDKKSYKCQKLRC